MPTITPTRHRNEQGFLLLGVIVMVALVLLVLAIAAPRVATELKHERELEAEHRGNEYVRAIRLYYTQLSTYPASMDQLDNTNNVRFLRQRYVDPITGKLDWRLIPVGQNKTTVKGFFGQPLGGLGGGGLGSASSMASPGQPGAGGGAFGASPAGATGGAFGAGGATGPGSDSGFGSSSFGSPGSGSPGGPGGSSSPTSGFGSSSSSSTSGFGASSTSGAPTTGTPFMGLGLQKDATSMVEYNGEKNYSTWEFLYDPRIEQLYAKASLFGGGVASSSGGLGSASSIASPGQGAPGAPSSSGSSFSSGNSFSSGSSPSPGSPSGSNGPGSTPPATPTPQ